ncbi:hypothetical protein B0H14DRAFT_2559220 [Mycena olivaceomarginata]|nr:hypothetical protein B0H14DRAFT_2559220 [Mycena olivaceomarginata]
MAKCRACLEKDSMSLREKRRDINPEKEKDSGEESDEDGNTSDSGFADDTSEFVGVPAIPVDTFLDALSAAGDVKTFSALVDVSCIEKEDTKDTVDHIAELVWERLDYRFQYVPFLSQFPKLNLMGW